MPTVTTITAYPFAIPLKTPFKIATMTSTHAEGVFVKVESDCGLTGWGEATPLHSINGETQATVVATLQKLAQFFRGAETDDDTLLLSAPLTLMPGQNAAISALEMAILDIRAQVQNKPLSSLLGSQLVRPLPTDLTIGIKSPEEAGREAAEIAARHIQTIKVKTGLDPQSDFERVDAVRQAAPNVKIRVDANQGYDADTALHALILLAPLDIEFCEQPVPRYDTDGLAYLDLHSPVPVMADESCFGPEDAALLVKLGACELINVKLSKSAGLLRGRMIAELCSQSGIRCMMGGMVETRLGVTAAAHLAASHSAFHFFDLDANDAHAIDPILGGATIQNGLLHLPSSAGLGAEPNPDFLRTLHPIRC